MVPHRMFKIFLLALFFLSAHPLSRIASANDSSAGLPIAALPTSFDECSHLLGEGAPFAFSEVKTTTPTIALSRHIYRDAKGGEVIIFRIGKSWGSELYVMEEPTAKLSTKKLEAWFRQAGFSRKIVIHPYDSKKKWPFDLSRFRNSTKDGNYVLRAQKTVNRDGAVKWRFGFLPFENEIEFPLNFVWPRFRLLDVVRYPNSTFDIVLQDEEDKKKPTIFTSRKEMVGVAGYKNALFELKNENNGGFTLEVWPVERPATPIQLKWDPLLKKLTYLVSGPDFQAVAEVDAAALGISQISFDP